MSDITFQALRAQGSTKKYDCKMTSMKTSELTEGQVLVRTKYSSLNYKDALAVTGKGHILKSIPLNPGIDMAGVVEEDSSGKFKPGESVLITGCNLGEKYDGGFGGYVRFHPEQVLSLPDNLSPKNAMILGTAGFTATLCLKRMDDNQQAYKNESILVTGASGGVGFLACYLLKKRGATVVATSSKESFKNIANKLGIDAAYLPEKILTQKPLDSGIYAGAIDNLGGEYLTSILAQTKDWGNVCSVGLTHSPSFSGTVMPHILRGVSLLGISSNNCPLQRRLKIWEYLANTVDFEELEEFLPVQEISLEEVTEQSEKMINQKTWGRTVVHVLD